MGTPWLSVGSERGGIQKSVFELARAMSRDHDVHVVCPAPIRPLDAQTSVEPKFHYAAVTELRRYPIPDELDISTEGVLLLIRLIFAIVAMAAAYAGLRRSLRFDVTYMSSKYVALPILLMGRRRSSGAFVYSERNTWPWLYAEPSGAWARLRYRFNVRLGKAVCTRSDGVHVNSDSLADAMAGQGIDRAVIDPIPNGVEVPPETATEPLAPEVRVGFVARLVEDKGVRILVETVRMLNEQRPSMRFDILGDGPSRAMIANANLRNCTLWGERPRTEVLETLRSIHVVLFLSPVENIPSNALLEALALGKAVVATKVGDTPRFLTDRKNALLCEPDPSAVTEAVVALTDAQELYDTVTAGARRLAGVYTWDAVARRHLAFYTSILAAVAG